MEFEHRPLDWFRPYARHPRVNDHAIGRLEAVIRAYGFKVPILARSNGDVVDGDLRLKVAIKFLGVNNMSRPRFVPTEERRRMVRAMSGYGVPQEDIATVLGLRSPKTLRKHFREEITRGAIDAKTQVLQTLHRMATSGKHLAATIFSAKTRCGLREIQIVESRPAATPDFIVALDKEAA